MTGVADENTNLLLNFFISSKQKLMMVKNDEKDHVRVGAIVILLHVCIIDGILSDQYIEWDIDALANRSGLKRVAKYKFVNSDFSHYQPRSVVGKAFHVDEAYFHVLVPQ